MRPSRLSPPNGLTVMGEHRKGVLLDRDPDMLAGLATDVHFNATAPVCPSRDQFRGIIADALG